MRIFLGSMLIILLVITGVATASQFDIELELEPYSIAKERGYLTFPPVDEINGATTNDGDETERFPGDGLDEEDEPTVMERVFKPSSQVEDFSPIVVDTVSARNIEYNSAKVRGLVDMHSYENGVAFVVYGYDRNKVLAIGRNYNTFANIPESTNDKARVVVFSKNAKGFKEYETKISKLIPDSDYYFQTCVSYKNLSEENIVRCGEVETFQTNLRYVRSNKFVAPSVSVKSATKVEYNSALLAGQVDMRDGTDGTVFFVYGEDKTKVSGVASTYDTYSSVKESGANLLKVRIETRLRGKSEYTESFTGLQKGTQYYYQLCVEYTGNQDGLKCSGTKYFTTDSKDLTKKPIAVTGGAIVQPGDRVRLSGGADMRAFHDGLVFFVYGTDAKQIIGTENKSSFNSIRQTIDKMQRLSVDNDLDSKNSYSTLISDFKSNSVYSYRLCIEYEDEDDNGREKLFLSCGEVKTFNTN